MEYAKAKKGLGLNDLAPAVMIIVVIGILLGVGIFVMNQTALAVSTNNYDIADEAVTVTSGAVALAKASECGAQDFRNGVVRNATTVISSGNYTISSDGYITNSSDTDFGNAWVVNYTYTGSGDEQYCTALTTSSDGLGGLASWIAVIVVVLAAAIVLGIVLSSFGDKGTGV